MIDQALNLLPPELQRLRRAERGYAFALRLLRIPTIAALITLLLTQSVLWFMDQHYTTLKKDEAAARQDAAATPSADVTKLTLQVNNQIATLRKTLTSSRTYHSAIVDILNELPKGVSITKVTLEAKNTVRMEGIADTRGTFLALQEAMKNSKVLKNAATTSTASKREQLPFIYTAMLAQP